MKILKLIAALLIAAVAGSTSAQSTVNQGQGNPKVTPWVFQGPPAAPGSAGGATISVPSFQRGAFGAVATETETVEIHLQFPYAINPRIVTTTLANGGTVTASGNLASVTTSAAVNGSASFASNSAIKYTPGQGISVRFTAKFTTCVAANTQEIGLGNTVDGFFFGCSGASFGVTRRQNGSDTFVAQTAWNGDRMNGGGSTVNPSGQTLTITNGNVYWIDFQWLGFGAIRFFAEDSTTGLPVLVHTIRYANTALSPSIFNPSLPLFARAVNTGNGTSVTLQTASMGAATQGPRNDFGVANGFTNVKALVGTTDTNIFTLRNNATFNAITNRTRIKLTSISVAVTAGASAKIILNGTEGGAPAFTDINTTQSVAAVDTAGTTVTVGSLVFPLATSFDQVFNLETLNLRLNPGETYNFSCASETATVTCRIGASWREEF